MADTEDFSYLKITKEIKEIENPSYELVYDIYNEWYSFIFDLGGKMYCIDIPYDLIIGNDEEYEIKLYK